MLIHKMCWPMMRSGGSMIPRRNWLPPILNVRLSNKIWSCASTYSHHQRVYIFTARKQSLRRLSTYSHHQRVYIFTARKQSLRRLFFYTCLSVISVHGGGGGGCLGPGPGGGWGVGRGGGVLGLEPGGGGGF